MTGVENLFLKQSWKSRGVPHSQISLLPNGAETNFLRPLPPDEPLLERWNLDGKKTLVDIGTHAYYQGLETVISGTARADERARTEPAANNIVLGSSPYDEMVRCYSIA
jgi:hypothetical protein